MPRLDLIYLGILAFVILVWYTAPFFFWLWLQYRAGTLLPQWATQTGLKLLPPAGDHDFESQPLLQASGLPPAPGRRFCGTDWILAGTFSGLPLQLRPVIDRRWEGRRGKKRPVARLAFEIRVFRPLGAGQPVQPLLEPPAFPFKSWPDGFLFYFPVGCLHPHKSGKSRILAWFLRPHLLTSALNKALELTQPVSGPQRMSHV